MDLPFQVSRIVVGAGKYNDGADLLLHKRKRIDPEI